MRPLAVAGLRVEGFGTWRPVRMVTDRSSLDALYARLPFRLPRLYEELILSFRWEEADLIGYRLLENPPGLDLSGLLSAILLDKHLYPTIFRHGFVQFAKGEDIDYDPVCFDTKRRRKGGDCPVVKLDHEEILCNERLVVVKELAPGFRELVQQTIEAARQIQVRFEIIEHPADVGFVAYGATREELFANAALAMMTLACDPQQLQERESRRIEVTGADSESLLYAWLAEILAIADAEQLFFCRAEVQAVEVGRVRGTVFGEKYEKQRHQAGTYIKAVTYHQLLVEKTAGGWRARVYLDV